MATASRPSLIAASTITLLTIALGGCAAADTPSTSTPTPTVALALEMDAAPVSGTGPMEPVPTVDFAIPNDARSVTIDFECSGGMNFHIEVGDPMSADQSALGGTCDGTTSLAWPLSDKTAATLSVWTAEGVDWVATPHFSTAEFVRDDAITAECAAFSTVYSALSNADIGYTQYQAFDEAEWRSRIDAASAELDSLAGSSETRLADSFATLLAAVRSENLAPGAMQSDTSSIDPISETCRTNHSELILTGEFGG